MKSREVQTRGKGFAPKPLTRKDRRKQERKDKKAMKHAFLLKLVGKMPQKDEKVVENPSKPPSSKAKQKKTVTFSDNTESVKRTKAEKTAKEYEAVRRKNLRRDNKEEDKEIKRLEKKLKLNKRKKKSLPQSFLSDGLDYLLDMCDPEKAANISSSAAYGDSGSEFEEDFRESTKNHLSDETLPDSALKKKSRFVERQKKEEFENVEKTDSMVLSSDSEASDLESDEEPEKSSTVKNRQAGGSTSSCAESDDEAPIRKKSESDFVMDYNTPHGSESDESDDESENCDEAEAVDANDSENENSGQWEDIYGRSRDKEGNVVNADTTAKYVPPGKRSDVGDDSKSASFLRLKRQLNGLLNRLSEANMVSIERECAALFASHSRNDMCRALNTSMMDSLVTKVLTPEKLLMEPAMLVALLHVHIGCEVGANFVEMLVKWFDELHSSDEALIAEDRRLDNIIFLLCHLQNFKVLDSTLMYDVLKSLCRKLSEKDVELILIILRTIGFSLRKQDANAMKEFIVEVKAKATEQAESYQGARIKFMLEALLAVKNNNALKMPNYDPEPVATMQKTLRMLIQGKTFDELKISLRDLLDAEKRGKWWVVGSAWTGKLPGEDPSGKPAKSQQTSKPAPIANASKEILELARKQRMNTEVRKNVFCIIMTSDDFMDAFEKLIKLGLNKHQDRELVVVSIDCCLQEKVFNPFYAHLVNRLCEYDRRFQLATQFSFWDRVKALKELEAWQLRNLARLFAFLFLKRGLPISVLKAIQFSDLDKKTLRLVRQILMSVLLTDTFDQDAVVDVFLRISQSTKLNELRESLKLFMHHFLLKNKSKLSPEQADLLEERVALADKALASGQKKFSL